jgi:hypothetical protein
MNTPLVASRRMTARPGEFALACGQHLFGVRPWGDGILRLTWEAPNTELPASPAALPPTGPAPAELEVRELPDGWRVLAPRLG